MAEWQDRGSRGGVQEWRLKLPRRVGSRQFVYVFLIGEGGDVLAQAESETGYITNFNTEAEAKAFLEARVVRLGA